MHTVRVAPTSPILQRTCLCCGYRGDELQRSGERAAYRCPRCGQDLYARPPKCYAEMEGIRVQLVPAARPGVAVKPPASRRGADKSIGFWRRLVLKLFTRLGLLGRWRGRVTSPVPQVRHRASSSRR